MLVIRSLGTETDASICRRHHQHGRWQARIGRVSGNKDLYLGTFSTCSSLVVTLLHIPMLPNRYRVLIMIGNGACFSLPVVAVGLPPEAVTV